MADQCFITYVNTPDLLDVENNDPAAVFLVQGNALTVTSKSSAFLDGWDEYVSLDPTWTDVHVESSAPLESLFSNGYTAGEFFPYDAQGKTKYEAAVKSLGGKTFTFKPKS